MATNKTLQSDSSVAAFIATVADEGQRADAFNIVSIMEKLSGEPPKMWGGAIIGFGRYHYSYENGREGDMCRIGFSPRKGKTVIYVVTGFPAHDHIMARLGKLKTGKSCLYIKRLSDVDQAVLEELIHASLDVMRTRYPD